MTKEVEINKQSLALQDIVDDLIVNNSLELENAVNMVKAIKNHREIIIEYWREAKESAKKTYHEILSKEKSMLNICDSAEKSCIGGITTQKRWQVRIKNNESIPAFWRGVEIREVSIKKLLEIRKENPSVKIPGVEFYQEESVVVRL